MKEWALELLSCKENALEEKEIGGLDAKYYRNMSRGGGAVIISGTGEVLFANPFFVDYDEHVKQFILGKRTTPVNH